MRIRCHRLLAAVILGGLVGCASRAIVIAPVALASVASSPSDRVWIMESVDGVFGATTYAGSGRRLAGRVLEALQSQYVDVQVIPTTREQDALEAVAQLSDDWRAQVYAVCATVTP